MRIEQLTFTRFIAAISIVIFHYGKECYLFNNEYVSFIFKQANFGVSYFFILSGFVMIIAYGEKTNLNFFDYIINRLARIYPVYLLALVLFLATTLFKNINLIDLILNVLMIQSWIPNKSLTLNFTGWSLSVEMFFYISFPFLLTFLYAKKSLRSLSVLIISFWILSQVLFHLLTNPAIVLLEFYSAKDMLYHPLLHLNGFLVGNLAGIYYMSKLKSINRNYALHILLIISILIILLKYPVGLNFQDGLLAVVFVPLILLISLSNDTLTALFRNRFFIFLGEISFGIYILQVPIWLIFSDYRLHKYFGLVKEDHFTLSFFTRLFLLIIAASLSYLYFEKPVRDGIKKLRAAPRNDVTQLERTTNQNE